MVLQRFENEHATPFRIKIIPEENNNFKLGANHSRRICFY